MCEDASSKMTDEELRYVQRYGNERRTPGDLPEIGMPPRKDDTDYFSESNR